MTRRERNHLLVGMASACCIMILPLLGIAIGFGLCGKIGAMGWLALVCVALILGATLSLINVRPTRG